MSELKDLTEAEFSEMLRLLQRHAETDMDQWAEWRFSSPRGTIFVRVSNAPDGQERDYIDVSHLLRQP